MPRPSTARRLLGALAAAQIGSARLPERHRLAATRGIAGLMLATSAADAVAARGRVRGTALVAGAGALGFASELAGAATGWPFGRRASGGRLGPRVRGVPVLAAAEWAMMARPAWVVGGLMTRSRPGRVLAAAGALTAWDVLLDPRMVREGYRTWPHGGRYGDVPLSSFAGWALTATGVFAVWSAADPLDDPLYDGDEALALYVWAWAAETVANAVVRRRPRVALAGATAMGAFAVPAALARRRRRRALP